jgi:DNA-directed RNA polymerase specialized sigma subunit
MVCCSKVMSHLPNKFYQNEKWMRKRYFHDRKTPEQIASECGVSHMTIYRYLRKFRMIK